MANRAARRRAAAMENMEKFDNFAPLRKGIANLANGLGEWAGIPMPLEGRELIMDPKYPQYDKLMKMNETTAALSHDKPKAEDVAFAKTVRIRNTFWSHKLSSTVIVIEDKVSGKIDFRIEPGIHHFRHDLMTLGASEAWGVEQEHNALKLLGTLVNHHRFKQYLLTGMFMETSKRSGLTYMFRKLKPTVVIDTKRDETRILCALCMHPIAYYNGSWAGAMCPTDDVIAHLMLMRGDEHMFWRRSNQHEPHRPEAGL